jgi:hypothetical protein
MLDWALEDDVMVVDTWNHSYQNKSNGNFKKNSSISNFVDSNPQKSNSQNASSSIGHLSQSVQLSQVRPSFLQPLSINITF